MDIVLKPIGWVINDREDVELREWGNVESRIDLVDEFNENSILGIEQFSHLEILYYFHLLDKEKIVTGWRHPLNNTALPRVGILAQRGRSRPNRLAASIVELVRVEGRSLIVNRLDAVNGTPIVDIKPVIREFLPRGEIRQPSWVNEVMADYWKAPQ